MDILHSMHDGGEISQGVLVRKLERSRDWLAFLDVVQGFSKHKGKFLPRRAHEGPDVE
jgi:hypothetical protein